MTSIQCARAILSSVDCLAVNFSILSFNRHDFRGKVIEVGAELFHAHGQTDGHDGARFRFSQFCERA